MRRQALMTLLGLGLLSALLFLSQTSAGDNAADEVERSWQENNDTASGALQQTVATLWTLKEAQKEQLRQDGVRNGLLAICTLMLGTMTVAAVMFRPSRESQAAARVVAESDLEKR
jgi:DMSO reductase anchor subunit